MGRPKVAILSTVGIVKAAIEILDREGEDEFTLSRVADRLGVKTSSLYNHIRSKDELVELIREVVVEPIDTEAFRRLPWDEAMLVWARSYRSAFAAHPNSIKLLSTRAIRAPIVLQMYEQEVSSMVGAGWPVEDCVPVINAIENFILGSALDLVAPTVMIDTDGRSDEVPLLTKAVKRDDGKRADGAFEIGLTALIDGFRMRLRSFVDSFDDRS
ncbi:MAG: TetR family transcriptional regulator [Acidimicrobiaceae bacterium]|nr:TetR family transcriptional regulator [Acidimicrobiaceae bacterium]